MADGSADVQAAIYAVLKGTSPPLLTVPVHAPARQDAPLPYVEIAESDTVALDVQCRDGLEENVTLHVWTRHDSLLLAKQIISTIRTAFHLNTLSVEGRDAFCAVTNTRLFPDANNEFLHGVITLRVNHFASEET